MTLVKLYIIFIKIDYLKFSDILCFLYNNQKDYKNRKLKSFAYNNLIQNNTPFFVFFPKENIQSNGSNSNLMQVNLIKLKF